MPADTTNPATPGLIPQALEPAPGPGGPAGDRSRRGSNLVVQIVLVGTGGLVRLTGSGLGCPTWPSCTGGLARAPRRRWASTG